MGDWQPYGESFARLRKDGLCKAGIQIDVRGAGLRLIGDLNEMGGVCDCCSEFSGQVIIERWRMIDPAYLR